MRRFPTFDLHILGFILCSIQLGLLHLPLPHLGQPRPEDGLPLLFQLLPLAALLGCLKKQTCVISLSIIYNTSVILGSDAHLVSEHVESFSLLPALFLIMGEGKVTHTKLSSL